MAVQHRPWQALEEVIVCLGEARDVHRGHVDCPRVSTIVPLSACGACRLLAWRENDRLPELECSTE